jgi:hypothetical protein
VFSLFKPIWLVPIAALSVALLDMPYGYYQLLRVLVFCATAYLALECQRRGYVAWAWALGGMAIVYNPFFKLALGRELWTLVNIATIVVFISHWMSTARTWEDSRPAS